MIQYLPYAIGLGVIIAAAVVALFVMFRADNIRAGEPFPTKLAVTQTFSAIRNGRELLAFLRKKDAAAPPPLAPRVMTPDEMKATITPGTLRAEDIPAFPPPRRQTPTTHETDRT